MRIEADFSCSQTWRDFYSGPGLKPGPSNMHFLHNAQSHTPLPSRETLCTCANCYHNLGEHCACREIEDMAYQDCPDWWPEERKW